MMKKTLKTAAALAVLATPAIAANMENPLYLPKAGEVYSKTAVGVMYKKTDSTDVLKLKQHAGAEEFPIYRVSEDLGVGITDRLMVRGQVGWTQDDDIARKGMHLGRLGLNYRTLDGSSTDGWILDLYADAHLGGISKMKGSINPNMTFNYDNYTTGQYGAYAGFQVGKKLSEKWTGALFAEAGYYFPSDNTEINIQNSPVGGLTAYGLSPNITAKMGSSVDYNIGTKFSYDWSEKLTSLFSLTWKHHDAHKIESVSAESLPAGGAPLVMAQTAIASFKDMDLKDGFNEYAIGVSAAYALYDNFQVVPYFEYTFDDGEPNSQNSTDIKAELGVRVNVAF
ncbi:MAG: hypothetical protein LBJ18_04085 [Rickettsiales bacterium]|nr:hypothetical protein [Rickettsiales bacterium]